MALTIGGACIALLALSAFDAARADADGTLTVSVVGKGDISGPSNDGSTTGIDCDETGLPDCSEFYADDCESNPDPPPPQFCFAQTVELTAEPDRNGYVFSSWSSNCVPATARTCQVTMSSSKTVTATFVDNTPPMVSGVSPSSGFHRGTITLSASASDPNGVTRIEFRVRGTLVGMDTTAPYQASYNTASVVDGAATLRATAFDPAGNAGFTEASFTIDNTAPIFSAFSGPNGQTYGPGSTQTWSFTAADAAPASAPSATPSGVASVQCSVVSVGDPASFGACSGGSSSHSVSNLGVGNYTFSVRATDNAGNPNTVTRNFSIAEDTSDPPPDGGGGSADIVAPETSIDKGPKKKTFKKKAKFLFSSTEAGSSFECKLDKGEFEPCASPLKFKAKRGKHRLEVRAIDAAGNADPTPDKHKWKVRRRR